MIDEKFWLNKYKAKITSTKGRKDKNGNAIEMRLSFEEYVKLFTDAGKKPSREYCLSRINDIGHYEIGNVFVQHNIHNVVDYLGLTSEKDRKITEYAIKNKYNRTIVKNMIKRGELSLEELEQA
jgi:hypothetical protein